MIKIGSFYEGKCEVHFEVKPIRPSQIHEPKLGLAIAKNSNDYSVHEDKKIYYSAGYVGIEHSLERLEEMQEEAQKRFSEKIRRLKDKVDEFNLLKELTKKEKK